MTTTRELIEAQGWLFAGWRGPWRRQPYAGAWARPLVILSALSSCEPPRIADLVFEPTMRTRTLIFS